MADVPLLTLLDHMQVCYRHREDGELTLLALAESPVVCCIEESVWFAHWSITYVAHELAALSPWVATSCTH